MTDKCVDIEMLGEILDAPAGDARREHVESCPRCWSRLRTYEEFLQAELAVGADPAAAELRLSGFFDTWLASKEARDVPPSRMQRLGRSLARAAVVLSPRPAWAAAAVIIVAGGLAVWHPWSVHPPTLRGSIPGDRAPLQLHPATPSEDGSVNLAWKPYPTADAYEVRLYGPELNEVARLGPTAEATTTLRRSDLPAGTPTTMFWNVVALREGDPIATSDPAPLELP